MTGFQLSSAILDCQKPKASPPPPKSIKRITTTTTRTPSCHTSKSCMSVGKVSRSNKSPGTAFITPKQGVSGRKVSSCAKSQDTSCLGPRSCLAICKVSSCTKPSGIPAKRCSYLARHHLGLRTSCRICQSNSGASCRNTT